MKRFFVSSGGFTDQGFFGRKGFLRVDSYEDTLSDSITSLFNLEKCIKFLESFRLSILKLFNEFTLKDIQLILSPINESANDMKLIISCQKSDNIFHFQNSQTVPITFANSKNSEILKTDEKIFDTETNKSKSNDAPLSKLNAPEHDDLTSDVPLIRLKNQMIKQKNWIRPYHLLIANIWLVGSIAREGQFYFNSMSDVFYCKFFHQ